MNSAEAINEADKEFEALFGRSYGGMVENYLCDDADAIIVTLGSVAGTTRIVVDDLRAKGYKVGLLKLRCIRPFPKDELKKILGNSKVVGVLEKDISFGYEGAVFTEVNSALSTLDKMPKTYNFIAGLGGRNISKNDIKEAFEKIIAYGNNNENASNLEFVKLGCEEYGN